MTTDNATVKGARAMFERHNSGCMQQIAWDDLSKAAQAGYIEDSKTCLNAVSAHDPTR